jgi:hypothetical protein
MTRWMGITNVQDSNESKLTASISRMYFTPNFIMSHVNVQVNSKKVDFKMLGKILVKMWQIFMAVIIKVRLLGGMWRHILWSVGTPASPYMMHTHKNHSLSW